MSIPQPGNYCGHTGFELEYGPVLLEIVEWRDTLSRVRVVNCFSPAPSHITIGKVLTVLSANLHPLNPLEVIALSTL